MSIQTSLQEHWLKLSLVLEEWGVEQEKLLQQLSVGMDGASPFLLISDGVEEANEGAPSMPSGFQDTSSEVVPPFALARKNSVISNYSTSSDILIGSRISSVFSPAGSAVHSRKRKRITIELQDVVQHKIFDRVTCFVIILNSILLSLSAEYAMQRSEQPSHHGSPNSVIDALELACAIYFVVEVSLQIFVQRRRFFCGSDFKWNIFDLALALQALLEQVEKYILQDTLGLSNFSFARMLRLLKTLKLLRVIRLMRSFRELRLILFCLLGCARAFLWACMLVVSLAFMLGICIMQTVVEYKSSIDGNADAKKIIYMYFDSVLTSTLSLFMFITSGQNWEIVGRPFREYAPFAYALLVFFLFSYYVVITNIVNSIFLESMMTQAQHDNQLTILRQIEDREDYINKLQAVYDEIDDEGIGEITYESFCKHCENPLLQAFINSMDIDISDARHFFRVLSNGGKHAVDLQTFIEGCIRLKGHARSSDLFDLLHQHRHVSCEIRQCLSDINDRLGSLISDTRTWRRPSISAFNTDKQTPQQDQSKSRNALFPSCAEPDSMVESL